MLFSECCYFFPYLMDLSSRWDGWFRINYHLVHHSVFILLEEADASISPPVLVESTCAGPAFATATSSERSS